METMPFEEDRNAVFARLAETAARANLTKEERARYDEQWRNYNDYYNTIDFEKGANKPQGRRKSRRWFGDARGKTTIWNKNNTIAPTAMMTKTDTMKKLKPISLTEVRGLWG